MAKGKSDTIWDIVEGIPEATRALAEQREAQHAS
jgi:hypothetical protein